MLGSRVGWRCSNPQCRAFTAGPADDPSRAVNVGVAAHITAASSGGPRYDPDMPPEVRRSTGNGIWLCETCARLIDGDSDRYGAGVLRYWKADSEELASIELGRPVNPSPELQPLRFSAIAVSDQCLWWRAHRLHKVRLNGGLRPDFGFHEVPRGAWPNVGKSAETHPIDPVLDVTLINDSSRTGTATAIGLELVESWTALKGLGVAQKVLPLDVYILELKRLEPRQPQMLLLPDPVAIPSGGLLRYQLWLAKFREAVGGNESLVRLVTEFEGRLHRSRVIYLGVY